MKILDAFDTSSCCVPGTMRLIMCPKPQFDPETGERQYPYECEICEKDWLGDGKGRFWCRVFGAIPVEKDVPDGWEICRRSDGDWTF